MSTARKTVRLNADDFGLTDGVCRGILEAMDAGVVGTTSAMACVAGAEERLRAHAGVLRGRAGAHLQLTGGVPICDPDHVPSLVTDEGRFPARREGIGAVDADELLREWTAQIETLKAWGIEPAHVDSHHHVHTRPEVLPVYRHLAQRFAVRARGWEELMPAFLRRAGVVCEDRCVIDWYDHELTRERLLALIDEALATVPDGGSIEVVCHPGHVDDDLTVVSSYAAPRGRELEVLCAPGLADDIAALGASLVRGGRRT